MVDVFFDPQTSGGLLISVPGQKAEALLARMHEEGIEEAAIVGEVVEEPKGKIVIK
jgi:selenide,water dikinase